MPARFDPELIQRGARLRRSPFFEATQRAGCLGYTIYNHMLLPIRYDDFEAEYRKLLADVTLWDVAVERNIEVAGPDGLRFAQLLTPRDLSKCPAGEGRYVVLADESGGIVNDPVLLRLDQNRFWLACADSDVLLWAKGVARGSALQVELRELGYEIYLLEPARGTELWDRVMAAGQPFGIAPTGPSDIRRIEAGILNYGIDMTLENNPYEVGLERLVELDKPTEFIGRAALRRIKQEGVRKKLAGIEIDGARLDLNMTRYPVRGGGHVTSCVYSPRLKKNIGYAMLPLPIATDLEIETPDGVRSARVVAMPFVDPKKQLAKES